MTTLNFASQLGRLRQIGILFPMEECEQITSRFRGTGMILGRYCRMLESKTMPTLVVIIPGDDCDELGQISLQLVIAIANCNARQLDISNKKVREVFAEIYSGTKWPDPYNLDEWQTIDSVFDETCIKVYERRIEALDLDLKAFRKTEISATWLPFTVFVSTVCVECTIVEATKGAKELIQPMLK